MWTKIILQFPFVKFFGCFFENMYTQCDRCIVYYRATNDRNLVSGIILTIQ